MKTIVLSMLVLALATAVLAGDDSYKSSEPKYGSADSDIQSQKGSSDSQSSSSGNSQSQAQDNDGEHGKGSSKQIQSGGTNSQSSSTGNSQSQSQDNSKDLKESYTTIYKPTLIQIDDSKKDAVKSKDSKSSHY